MGVADRMAVMKDGRIAQVGPPREVYERPASRFVAGFIGEANLFPDGDGFRMVRPERMILAATASPGAVTGRVAEIAYFGDRTRYVVKTDAGKPLLVSRAAGEPPLPLAVGEAAFVNWSPEAAVPSSTSPPMRRAASIACPIRRPRAASTPSRNRWRWRWPASASAWSRPRRAAPKRRRAAFHAMRRAIRTGKRPGWPKW